MIFVRGPKALLGGGRRIAAISLLITGLALVATAAVVGPPISPAPAAASPATLPVAGHALTAVDVEAWMDGLMPTALDTAQVPGAVVVVVKDGQVLFEKGYGYADYARQVPVDPRKTLFRPGSVSKLFTWTAVMQLVEQGRIDLDADVNRYLDFSIPRYHGAPVTMRDLMTHRAGFSETARDLLTYGKAPPPLDVVLKRYVPPRIFAPAGGPGYSNYGASLAGYIVQRVSGQPFDDYVDQHIFAPLGMTRSTFAQPLPAALAARHVEGIRHVGQAEPRLRDHQPAAGRLAVVHRRRHGAVHDRATGGRRLRRRAYPAAADRPDDAHHRVEGVPGPRRQPARLLPAERQRPSGHRARRRHQRFPQRPEPVPRRRGGPVRLGQRPRQGRPGRIHPQQPVRRIRRPLFPGRRAPPHRHRASTPPRRASTRR